MKNRRTINIKRLIASLEKKYGSSDLFSLVLPYTDLASADRRIKYPDFFDKVKSSVYPSYTSDAKEIARSAGDNNGYRELSHFYSYAVINALIILDESAPSEDILVKTVTYFKALFALETEKLYHELSEAERILSDSIYFKDCDEATKNECRRQVLICSKKHSISESEAATLFLRRDPFDIGRGIAARLYFPILGIISALFSVIALVVTKNPAFFFFVLLPMSEAAKQVTDCIFSYTVKTRPIPKKKLKKVPESAKTLTVITALLNGKESDLELCKKIRDCCFSNKGENAYFGLLCDLKESEFPTCPSDRDTEKRVGDKIDEINRKYGTNIVFFLRDRRYAPTEGKYMGWERKRGAVIELTRYLRGKDTGIRAVSGDPSPLFDTKYIITLDSDTRLYTGAVTDLLGTMLHPSNKPVIEGKRVVKGHAILQPRMEASLSSAEKTPFAVLSAESGGSDIYATAAYETYQSVFGEGIFCGKGIFDLDVYSALIDGAFPDGSVLSHDLLEGSRLRAGAVTDISLTDDLPKSPLSCFDRSHRWIRGDVQALAFAGKYVKNEKEKSCRNPISGLSVFKLYDNVRRALVPISASLALLLCIFRPPELSPYISLLALLYLFVPFVLSLLTTLKSCRRRFFSHLIPASVSAFLSLIYAISSLIHTALRNADAVFRAGFRVLFSRKKLLEWKTASESDGIKGLPLVLYTMLPSMLIGLALLVFCPRVPLKILGALTFVFPFACHRIGAPFKSKDRLSDGDGKKIREYAKASWSFFSERVGKEDNFLPPDNIQFSPVERVAHRTSPTNIGLYLLSVAGAAKLGIINENEALSRIKNTIDTVSLMPKWHGHLYNWYDTETLFILGQSYVSTVDSGNFITALVALKELLSAEFEESEKKSELISKLEKMISDADFSLLYDSKKKLMLIGINPEKPESDPPCYDFFTSEERTTSFYAIASGAVPREHWRYLRRIPTVIGGYTALYSWTGTMFEYLMPSLILPTVKGSLSYEALSSAVREQKKYLSGGVWGRSESGYFDFDRDLNYQYKAFGIPSLGLKKGLERDTVISPYSSFLALPFDRSAALNNLKRLERKGMYGAHGFYEALDMAPERVGRGYAVIKSHMSHHVGMSIVAMANTCLDNIFVRAFMSDPYCSSAAELLEEKVPKGFKPVKIKKLKAEKAETKPPLPRFLPFEKPSLPKEHGAFLISEGSLSAAVIGDMLRLSGLKGEISIDPFVFGRIYRPRILLSVDGSTFDLMSGRLKGESGRRISWSYDSRRFVSEASLSLLGRDKTFVFSIYAEGHFKSIAPMLVLFPSLSPSNDRASHPSYTDLEVVAEYREDEKALLFSKQERSAEDGEKCFAVSLESAGGGAEFLTRRESLPAMFEDRDIEALIKRKLESKAGTLTEPLCAVKKASCSSGKYLLNILVSVGRSKSEAMHNLHSARKLIKAEKGKNGAYIAERLMNERKDGLPALTSDIRFKPLLSQLLSFIMMPKKRVPHGSYSINDFYRHGISGDNPLICLILERDISRTSPCLRWLELFVLCHKYLSLSGVKLDTVILYDGGGEYMCEKREAITDTVKRCAAGFFLKGGIYLIDGYEDIDLFENTAAAVAHLDGGFTLESFVSKNRASDAPQTLPIKHISSQRQAYIPDGALPVYGGYFENDGFTLNKTERGEKRLPHSYVYALNHFGTLVTDSSLGYTWIGNSHERRLTPFLPDSRRQMDGETLIATVADAEYDLAACSHTVSFKRGCAVWEGTAGPVSYTVTASIDTKLPCKAVTVHYVGAADIKTEYRIRPVLGDRERRNRPIRVDKRENITLYAPTVSGECSDTAFVLKREFGNTVCFLLGAFPSGAERVLDTMVDKYKSRESFFVCAEEYERRLRMLLPKIKTELPDKYLSVMTEYYLPYQSLVCRFYGRTGFYQSGGAYGFRDQLQDCLSIMLSAPSIARTHILRCACRQYEEGDVNHWWHIIRGVCRGVRTRYSDDLLWLPYVASRYAAFTGDHGIFDIELPYISSPPLRENERDRYECPSRSKYRSSLYFHCVKAIERSLSFGNHGLPLMGGGDWNDGMNEVGLGGGESVWLGMFLALVLDGFAPISARLGDISGAAKYRRVRDELVAACEKCFDGQKYLRAFYADGTPLGGEGFTDILPQAFSVFAKCGEKRSKIALKTAFMSLFSAENGTFSLLFPPFSRPNECDPGYISSYPPGVRENGGQYTHAAAWAVLAMANIGMGREAAEAVMKINPAALCRSREGAERYRGEPYFVAGDVATAPDIAGRCGWSLYTGSAGWLFSAVFAGILGIVIEGDSFTVSPSLSDKLPHYSLTLEMFDTVYEINAHIGRERRYNLDGKNVNNLFHFDKNYHLLEITVEISSDME